MTGIILEGTAYARISLMLWIMAAKLLGTFVGVILWRNGAASPYLVAFAIGILPIWLELLASRLTRVEAGHEKRPAFLVLDALVDGGSFVFAPAIWYSTFTRGGIYVFGPEIIFVFAGVFRLVKFAAKGMGADGAFHGLPVTYTGYLWLLSVILESTTHFVVISVLLALISIAMVSDRIRIRPA